MNVIWEKLYYRVQTLFVFLQKKLIAKELGLPKKNYRVDLLRTLKPVNGSVENAEILVDIGANEGEFSNIKNNPLWQTKTFATEKARYIKLRALKNTEGNNEGCRWAG